MKLITKVYFNEDDYYGFGNVLACIYNDKETYPELNSLIEDFLFVDRILTSKRKMIILGDLRQFKNAFIKYETFLREVKNQEDIRGEYKKALNFLNKLITFLNQN